MSDYLYPDNATFRHDFSPARLDLLSNSAFALCWDLAKDDTMFETGILPVRFMSILKYPLPSNPYASK